MSRLTINQLENYRNTYERFDGIESSEFEKICDELIEYKALEEELGISLPILFKAMKKGVYFKSVNSGIHYIPDTCLELVYTFGVFELWVDGHKTFDGLLIHLKDYKKRWALCEEDLKSE